ncbi:hypothetical protein [Pyrobaculum aerophilum]|uniref:hypothetical protein n=1 Tax=Pyrobaculum aerophilum TaxID=13773 RepID=UPI0023F1727F|nr:hypothetical protein [Pyrobaculum aerophilum]MCX8137779.1 hypothetical protein [Pyrobaculum aerophilum]
MASPIGSASKGAGVYVDPPRKYFKAYTDVKEISMMLTKAATVEALGMASLVIGVAVGLIKRKGG